MKKFLSIQNIIIVVLAVILILQRCGKDNNTPQTETKVNGKKYILIKKEIDTFEVEKKIVIKKPGKDIYHDTTIYVQVPQSVDTAEILSKYYAKNVFKDTLKFPDSLGYVTITDTISENKILTRVSDSRVKERIIKEKEYLQIPPKNQLYVGVNTAIDKTNFFNSVGAGVVLKTKKDQLYQLNMGVSGKALTPYVGAGTYWKIKLRKD